MDLSSSLALLNLFTLNIPVTPTAGEMETQYETQIRLKNDLFKDYTNTIPRKPTRVIPILNIDHIRTVNAKQGVITASVTFVFAWMDDRLRWNPTNYSGIRVMSGDRSEFMAEDIWTPNLYLADLPSGARNYDLFGNFDTEVFLTSGGSVRVSIKTLVTVPCNFGYGDFPNDYQNCSFTLMTSQYADEVIFSDWGGAEFAKYLFNENNVADVLDFELIDIDSQHYFMYLGLKIVDDIKKYKASYCRAYYRFNLMLKRANKLVFAQISAPMIAISMFVGMSGILPDNFCLTSLVFSIGVQLFNAINLAEVLPNDFNGMPTIGVLSLFMMVETLALICWRIFAIHIRKTSNYNRYGFPNKSDARDAFLLHIVTVADGALKVVLIFQAIGNIYIIMHN